MVSFPNEVSCSPETTLEALGVQSATQFDVEEGDNSAARSGGGSASAAVSSGDASGAGAVDLVDDSQWSCPQWCVPPLLTRIVRSIPPSVADER